MEKSDRHMRDVLDGIASSAPSAGPSPPPRPDPAGRSRTSLALGAALIFVGGLAVVVVIVLGDSSTTQAPNASPLHAQVQQLPQGGSEAPPLYSSAVEATPGTRFLVEGVEYPPASDLLVVGRVAEVREGRSFSWPDGPQIAGGPPTRVEHKFNDPASVISTLVVDVSVDDFRPETSERDIGDEVTVEISLGSPIDVAALSAELLGRRVVGLLLSNDKTPFDLDPTHYGVLEMGEFLGFVGGDDTVVFGSVTQDGHAERTENTERVPLEALLNPPAIVELELVDGVPTKVGESRPHATIERSSDRLTHADGEEIEVSGRGYKPDSEFTILQCVQDFIDGPDPSLCDLSAVSQVRADAQGDFATAYELRASITVVAPGGEKDIVDCSSESCLLVMVNPSHYEEAVTWPLNFGISDDVPTATLPD